MGEEEEGEEEEETERGRRERKGVRWGGGRDGEEEGVGWKE